MRFILTPVGSAGDVHPFVGIGRALKARGHEVIVLTAGPFGEVVRNAGLVFRRDGVRRRVRCGLKASGPLASAPRAASGPRRSGIEIAPGIRAPQGSARARPHGPGRAFAQLLHAEYSKRCIASRRPRYIWRLRSSAPIYAQPALRPWAGRLELAACGSSEASGGPSIASCSIPTSSPRSTSGDASLDFRR